MADQPRRGPRQLQGTQPAPLAARARGEHAFHAGRNLWGFRKVRYCGLAKHSALCAERGGRVSTESDGQEERPSDPRLLPTGPPVAVLPMIRCTIAGRNERNWCVSVARDRYCFNLISLLPGDRQATS